MYMVFICFGYGLKGITQKCQFCHLLTLNVFQTCMSFFVEHKIYFEEWW